MEAYPMEKEMDPPPMKQILKILRFLWLQIPVQLFLIPEKSQSAKKPNHPNPTHTIWETDTPIAKYKILNLS